VQSYSITNAIQVVNFVSTEKALMCVITATDTILAVSIAVLLYKPRSGFGKTDTILKRITMYTIGTRLVTALWGLIGLVGTVQLPQDDVYLMVNLVIRAFQNFQPLNSSLCLQCI
jgi:hypothetical protein